MRTRALHLCADGPLAACWFTASAPWDEWACLCGWRGRGGPQKERETGMGPDCGKQAAGMDGGHLRRGGGRLLRG